MTPQQPGMPIFAQADVIDSNRSKNIFPGAPGANPNPQWTGAGANPTAAGAAPVTAWSSNPWAGAGNAANAWAQYYAYYAQQQQGQPQATNAASPKLPAATAATTPSQQYKPGWQQPPAPKPHVTAAPQWAPTVSSGGAAQTKTPAASSWAGVANGGGYSKPPSNTGASASYAAYTQYQTVESTYDPESGSSTGAEPAPKKQKISDTPTYNPTYSATTNRYPTNSSMGTQSHQQVHRPPPPAQKPQQAVSPQEWPESLKRYVERAFAQYPGEKDRALMEAKLRNIIRSAIENDSLKKRDWDKLPLPQLETSHAGAGAPKKFTPPQHMLAQGGLAAGGPKAKKGGNNNKGNGDPFMGEGAPTESSKKTLERQKRFAKDSGSYGHKYQDITTLLANAQTSTGEVDWDTLRITGTGTFLEKPYLRLTSIPDPSSVRSEAVLKKAVEFVKQKWKQGAGWHYVTDQFKSIRQDLTVQGIYNEFTVQVYETHARLCLENGDIGEYNQCQGQLKDLFRMGVSGHVLEFTAYRLVYYLYNDDVGGLTHLLAELTPEMLQSAEVTHALEVVTAATTENYHRFFKLYLKAPNMGQYLMDHLFSRIRFAALKTMAKSYRPEKLPIDFLKQELNFESAEECVTFIEAHGGILETNKTELNTKDSVGGFKNYEDNLEIVK